MNYDEFSSVTCRKASRVVVPAVTVLLAMLMFTYQIIAGSLAGSGQLPAPGSVSGTPTEAPEIPPPLTASAPLPPAPTMTGPVEPEQRTIQYSYGERNEHCAGARNVRWRVTAPDGWRIVRNSIQLDGATSSKSTYNGVADVSDTEFFVTGLIANNGECIRLLGKTVARDGRGRLAVSGTYVVERIP